MLIGDARIVYQNIYPAKILDGFLYHMGTVRMDGQIRLYGQRFYPIGSALCGGLLQQLIAAGAQHHSGAFLSKTDGSGLANAGVCTGYNGDFIFKTFHQSQLLIIYLHPF